VELTRRSIPFVVRSGTRFFEQAHIKDVIAFLRARNNPRDELAWSRMLRLWPGVGTLTAARLARRLSDEQHPVPARNAFAETARQGQGRARESMHQLSALWVALDEATAAGPAEEIRLIVERHYADYAERNFPNASARREDIENLARFAGRYERGVDLLSELALLEGMVGENVGAGSDPDDKLVLSTIHQAKGLEWPHCFVLWLASGRFPTPRAQRTSKDLEEERRLFYVSATRAGDELYLCYPTLDEAHDGPVRLMRPSPFLVEVDHAPDVFERWDIEEAPA
jgi:DNA helicase-2/ATP-dependent DNA helicase PcrA